MYKMKENGIGVERLLHEDDESLIRRFKKKVSKSGVLKEFRLRMYYEKPSSKKRRKKLLAIKAMKRENDEDVIKFKKKGEPDENDRSWGKRTSRSSEEKRQNRKRLDNSRYS